MSKFLKSIIKILVLLLVGYIVLVKSLNIPEKIMKKYIQKCILVM